MFQLTCARFYYRFINLNLKWQFLDAPNKSLFRQNGTLLWFLTSKNKKEWGTYVFLVFEVYLFKLAWEKDYQLESYFSAMKKLKGELLQEYADLIKQHKDTMDELKERVEILELRVSINCLSMNTLVFNAYTNDELLKWTCSNCALINLSNSVFDSEISDSDSSTNRGQNDENNLPKVKKQSLRITIIHFRSIWSNKEQLNKRLREHNIDVIIGSETHILIRLSRAPILRIHDIFIGFNGTCFFSKVERFLKFFWEGARKYKARQKFLRAKFFSLHMPMPVIVSMWRSHTNRSINTKILTSLGCLMKKLSLRTESCLVILCHQMSHQRAPLLLCCG